MYPPEGRGRHGTDWAPSRALCASCPVIDACRDWGDQNEPRAQPFGMLAGETPRQRRDRRARERRR